MKHASIFFLPWIMLTSLAPAQEASRPIAAQVASAERFEPYNDLKRIMVGCQAGIVKVFDRDRKNVAFFRGIDDRTLAPVDSASRQGILAALAIDPTRLDRTAVELVQDYGNLPHKEAVALLGVLGSAPDSDFNSDTQRRVQDFLCAVLTTDPDVATRRQAILALAVMNTASPKTVEQVVSDFEHCENLWETYPVQQFFEYHAAQIRALPDYPQWRARLGQVSSLYTPFVLTCLDGPHP